jgi:hypothetical protein
VTIKLTSTTTGAAFEQEVAAYRKAQQAFLEVIDRECSGAGDKDRLLRALAESAHVHDGMLALMNGSAVGIRVTVEFSEVVSAAELAEQIAYAARFPGGTPAA